MVNIQDSTNTPEFYEWKRIKEAEGSKAAHQYYLRSAHWKEARATILARDGQTCKLCGIDAPKTKEKYLHVHHQTYARLWKERQKDLISLCNPCHTEIHKAGGTLKLTKYLARKKTISTAAPCTHVNKLAKKKKNKKKKHIGIAQKRKNWQNRLKKIQKQLDTKRTTRRRPAAS